MNPLYAAVALRAGHRCEYCHAPEAVFNFPFEVEHILPVARAGSDAGGNLALACRSCNLRKAAHVTGVDPHGQEVVALFHPREGDWAAHFRVDEERAEVEGLTTLGRATVSRLAMNSPAQGAARRQWMRLGLLPLSRRGTMPALRRAKAHRSFAADATGLIFGRNAWQRPYDQALQLAKNLREIALG